jgi:HPr kinase/phosphorylase
MSQSLTIQEVVERIGKRLQLRWVGSAPGEEIPIRGDFPGAAHQALIGPLNCIHPNRVQIIGHAELVYLAGLGPVAQRETLDKLFNDRPAAVVFADAIEPDTDILRMAEREGTPLLASPLGDDELIRNLQYLLSHALAERTTLHGVFMEVLGMGVLLTGAAAVGKSELALALISRGHRLVADDAPEFAQTVPDILNGTCPPLLRDFLEVRGLGILNIRAMFGDSAVRRKKDLHLIVHLQKMDDQELSRMDRRLEGSQSVCTVQGVAIPQLTVPVAPGRNLAILVEAAVRHQSLRMRGYDASIDFAERQARMIESGMAPEPPLA